MPFALDSILCALREKLPDVRTQELAWKLLQALSVCAKATWFPCQGESYFNVNEFSATSPRAHCIKS